jgi:hypothetical protein
MGIVASSCWGCVTGLHFECLATVDETEEGLVHCCCSLAQVIYEDDEKRSVGRPMLDVSEITDIRSTGRKRAAMLYPIFADMQCEWAFLRHAGGGIEPIIGCNGNIIQPIKSGPSKGDRHHGPDKSVINNSPDNVHRICSPCHNRWHAANNKFYGERPPADQPYLPLEEHGELKIHDRDTRATEEELQQNEEFWASKKNILDKVDTKD